jgi:membrane protein implicated in regulation of membrane protease activity
MGQSRTSSFIEGATNTISGLLICMLATQALGPVLGYDIPIISNVMLTFILTIISLVRTYFWRRFFERRTKRKVQNEKY